MPKNFDETTRIEHSCLVVRPARPLAEAEIGDDQRLGVVLEGCALLGHLHHARWRLLSGWEHAGVAQDGRLSCVRTTRGRDTRLTQTRLIELVLTLFRSAGEAGSGAAPCGRGVARRAARGLVESWRQTVVPLSADEVVAQILALAPFLWRERLAIHWQSLVAAHHEPGCSYMWVAGSGRARRAILGQGEDPRGLGDLICSARGRRIWRRSMALSPTTEELADGDGLGASGCVHRGAELTHRGHPSAALGWLQGLAGRGADLLRVRCQIDRGRLRAARSELARVEARRLSAAERIEAAQLEIEISSRSGPRSALRAATERATRLGRGDLRFAAHLAAARGALALGQLAAADDLIHRAPAAPSADETLSPTAEILSRELHHLRARLALERYEGPAAVKHLTLALGLRRRAIARLEAGRLWRSLGLARQLGGDLAGAERAMLHSVRLLRCNRVSSEVLLSLVELAAIRWRVGRVSEMDDILDLACAHQRRSGDRLGAARSALLRIRGDLDRGRLRSALDACRRLRRAPAEKGWSASDREMLRLLSARAMGWRGRQEEAAKELRGVSVSAILALDPEERAAVWIHAGRREEAVAAARGCSLADLWLTFLRGSSLDPGDWDRVAGLPSRRQARLVFDLFLLDRDRVPESWLRRALATFSRLGSDEPAMRLRSWLRGPWHALETYLRVDSHGTGAAAELFAAAGRSDVLLVWESTERNVVLVAGAGGPEEISCPLREGRLVLRTAHLDERLRALFHVILDRVSIPADPRVESGEISEGMIGESGAFVGAIRRLRLLAPSRLPILLLGESGTGKELAARAIHSLSPRSDGPFLAYNAAAVSEPLLLADLFGHVRGAFTGADRDREGVFESARCGTVLLDEIGDLPLAAQGALLRVLQEGEIRRVGESRARRVDIRIVAATHRDLEAMVAAGDFRQDLYFRLSVATIRLPPLRERSRDVLLLTDHFLARHSHGSSLSRGARERLLGHDWPGNVRELENVLQVAGTLSSGSGCIRSCHLELPPSRRSPADRSSYHERIDAHRRRILREALEAAQGHRARAAKKLGITRQALSYLVRTLDLA